MRRRRIHADLPIPVHGHEPERGIHRLVYHREVQLVVLGNGSPVMDTGAAERIDTHANVRAADRIHVDDVAEVSHVVA